MQTTVRTVMTVEAVLMLAVSNLPPPYIFNGQGRISVSVLWGTSAMLAPGGFVPLSLDLVYEYESVCTTAFLSCANRMVGIGLGI